MLHLKLVKIGKYILESFTDFYVNLPYVYPLVILQVKGISYGRTCLLPTVHICLGGTLVQP